MQQHILIAGAGKGIGLELVKQMLVTENNIILAVSRDISQLRILAEKVNTDAGAVRLIPLASDLAKPDFTKVLEYYIDKSILKTLSKCKEVQLELKDEIKEYLLNF